MYTDYYKLALSHQEMTKVSSGAKKSGPPTHANRYAFTHNRNSRLTRAILSSPISSTLCQACREVIEWRKRFRKYKPLTVPKRCVRCQEKTVKEAYHVICGNCTIKDGACAKCLVDLANMRPDTTQNNQPYDFIDEEQLDVESNVLLDGQEPSLVRIYSLGEKEEEDDDGDAPR